MILTLHTTLVIAHLVGIVLGVGGATSADFLILRRAVFMPIKSDVIDMVKFLSTLVTAGLVLLWISGIALAIEVWLRTPAFLSNEKFWAKVTIVAVLTANAFVIHHVALPKLRLQAGRKLFSGLSLGDLISFVGPSAISAVSWYLPLVLGPARELSYVVPFGKIILTYLWIVNVTAFLMVCLALWSTRPHVRSNVDRRSPPQGGRRSGPVSAT